LALVIKLIFSQISLRHEDKYFLNWFYFEKRLLFGLTLDLTVIGIYCIIMVMNS